MGLVGHWAMPYLGRPYHKTKFHCWAAARLMQREVFGRDLPAVSAPQSLLDTAKAFREHPEIAALYEEVVQPAEGDMVLLRRARYPIHVGIWTDADGGKVVHCAEDKGVEAPRLEALLSGGWQVEGYYRFRG